MDPVCFVVFMLSILNQYSINIFRSEYDTVGTSVKAAVVYLGTALVKVVKLISAVGYRKTFGIC